MKKIINGKLYDTDKATLLYLDRDTKRGFYMTPNRAFFTFYPNGEIVPRSEDYAKEYLGAVDVDKYIEIFGEPEEA